MVEWSIGRATGGSHSPGPFRISISELLATGHHVNVTWSQRKGSVVVVHTDPASASTDPTVPTSGSVRLDPTFWRKIELLSPSSLYLRFGTTGYREAFVEETLLLYVYMF